MKLSTMFLIMFVIQASIFITAQGTFQETTPFWQAAQDPTNWQAIVVSVLIGSLIATVGGAVVVIGALLLGKNDLVVFALPVGLMIGWLTPIVSLWRMLTSESYGLGMAGWFLSVLICGPLIILGLYSVMTWWRTTFEG